MPAYYIYLISSLPMLHFGSRPPFSFEKFLSLCKDLVSEEDLNALGSLGIEDHDPAATRQPTERKFRLFETALRNELAKIRSARKRLDPAKYTRPGDYADTSIIHTALTAYRNPSPLEAEKILDREKWRALDELELGRYFDMDFLIIYAHKLLILNKWMKIETADKAALTESMAARS